MLDLREHVIEWLARDAGFPFLNSMPVADRAQVRARADSLLSVIDPDGKLNEHGTLSDDASTLTTEADAEHDTYTAAEGC